MLWISIVACTEQEDPTDPTSPSTSSGVTCAAQPDNALRVDCTLETAATTLAYTGPDGVTVEVEAPEARAVHTLWGLRPDTTYDVDVQGETTRFTTGALPEALADLSVETTGASSLDAVVQELICDDAPYVVVLDTEGAVRWYQAVPQPESGPGPQLGGGDIMGLSVTDSPSVVVLTGGGIHEWSFTGAPGVTVEVGPTDPRLHHDVVRAGDDTLALFQEVITGPDEQAYLVDGVAVYDAVGALVEQWHLADHVDPSQLAAGGGPPEGMGPTPEAGEPVDWSHANGITVTEDGGWIVSFRWLSAIYGIDGRRGESSFGEISGIVTGDPTSPIPSSFVIDADGQFLGQHHGTLVGDELTVFDNRRPPESSRTVTLRLDEDSGTATTLETHALGENCPVEGAAHPLPDGGVFATCSTSGIGLEFPAGSGDTPSFTIRASCSDRQPPVGRIVPFALP